MKQSSRLFKDKQLDVPLTEKDVEALYDKHGFIKVKYFFDGNNGDRHLMVGFTTDENGDVNQLLGVNLSQCYLTGSYNGYSNANKVVEDMKMPANGQELAGLLNKVMVYTF